MFAITRTQSYKTDYANIKIYDLLELGKNTFFWRKLWRIIYAKICALKIAKNYAKNGFIKPKLDWLLDLLQQRCKHGFGTE
jgi:hypothetical protein